MTVGLYPCFYPCFIGSGGGEGEGILIFEIQTSFDFKLLLDFADLEQYSNRKSLSLFILPFLHRRIIIVFRSLLSSNNNNNNNRF